MDKSPKPVAAIAPFGLRMQPALKAELEESAKLNARSLNAEIVARLEESLQGKELVGPDGKRILSALQRLEGLLATTEGRLSLADHRTLVIANALAAAYPFIYAVIESSPEAKRSLERPVSAGMRLVQDFVQTYKPRGYSVMAEVTAKAREMFPDAMSGAPLPEHYAEVSDKVKAVEERTIQRIKMTLDQFPIADNPGASDIRDTPPKPKKD